MRVVSNTKKLRVEKTQKGDLYLCLSRDQVRTMSRAVARVPNSSSVIITIIPRLMEFENGDLQIPSLEFLREFVVSCECERQLQSNMHAFPDGGLA